MNTTKRQTFTALCALVVVSLAMVGCSDSPSGTGTPAQQVAVIVRFEGDGSGRVQSSHSAVGIDCTSATPQNSCTSTFNAVGTFELLATPNAGSTLAVWACSATKPEPVANCGACTGNGSCQLSTTCCDDVTLTVIARFEPVGPASLAAASTGRSP